MNGPPLTSLQLDLSMSTALATWRQFELASEQAERLGCKGRALWVYAVELSDHLNLDRADAPTVWLGQTHLEPEVRLQQHREGYRADSRVESFGTELRPDLYLDQPILRTRQEADAYQQLLAETLFNSGYSVYHEA